MADESVTVVQCETGPVVFVEHATLTYRVSKGARGERALHTGPRDWYASEDVTVVKDRWIYLFARAAAGPLGVVGWFGFHEYYVDGAGIYWRTDEADLLESDPTDIIRRFRPVEHREAMMASKQGSGAGTPYVRLPYYTNAEKCTIVSVAAPYAIPARRLGELAEVAELLLLPWAVAWPTAAAPAVHIVGEGTVTELVELGGETRPREVAVDFVPTVDPFELAVRTNRVYQRELAAFRKLAAAQTDEERFARELHQIVSCSPGIASVAEGALIGGDLDVIRGVFRASDERLADAAARYEARARVLVELLGSRLFGTMMRALRQRDVSSPHDSPKLIYFLHILDAATEQLGLSRAGGDFLRRMAAPQGVFGAEDPIGSYVFPAGPVESRAEANVQKALPPILSLFGALFSRLELDDPLLAAEIARRYLTRLTGHAFDGPRRGAALIPDGFMVEYDAPDQVVAGGWISKADLKQLRARALDAAEARIDGRRVLLEGGELMEKVSLALDVINLALTEVEFAHKQSTGRVRFRESVDQFNARISVGVSVITAYATWRVGEKAASALVSKLAVLGALPAAGAAFLTITDSWESYDKGQYGKYAGQAIAGWAGLVGAGAALVPGAGWVVAAAGLIAMAGGMVADAYTRTPLEEFFTFCEWGVGGGSRESREKPTFSSHPFHTWKGRYDVQRGALTRILCSFVLEPVYADRRGVRVTWSYLQPESELEIRWEAPEEPGKVHTSRISGHALRHPHAAVLYEPRAMMELLRVSVTVTLDVAGDGRLLVPTKGCKLILDAEAHPSGRASSLDVPE